MKFPNIDYLMSIALDEANRAYGLQEVPVGCVITDKSGVILAKTHNLKETNQNACHHAEILAIAEASKALSSWRLVDCELFVTLEPCPMCMSAISQARIKNVYFGAYDKKGGAASLGLNHHADPRLNHKLNLFGGFSHLKCSKIISDFFQAKRKNYRKS